jgi:hypothetical protein
MQRKEAKNAKIKAQFSANSVVRKMHCGKKNTHRSAKPKLFRVNYSF